jgi:cardiolipin synthase
VTVAPAAARALPPEVVERAMDRAAGSRPIPGNRVVLLFDGPEVYPAMLERIAAARKWIHLDNYIIRSDATGLRFADALVERARAGIPVRVQTDWFGSLTTRRRFWRRLRRAGVSVRWFNPPRPLRLRENLSRDHRKLLVIDGETAVTGGLCLGNEWAGDPAAGRQPWRDTGVAIDGPAAAALDRAFASVWRLTGPPLEEGELSAEAPMRGESVVRVVAGEPGGVRASRATELLLAGAAERIWITDAYLVAPRGLYQGLLDAAHEGVDVRVLVPGTSDLPRVQRLTRVDYYDLLRAGVRIFEWRGPMLHAKTIVVDGRWIRIGSSNLNLSSLLANYEIDILADDVALARAMEAQFRRDIDRSVEVRLMEPDADRPSRALKALKPELERAQPSHHPGLRERRRRAVVALRAVLTGSRSGLLLKLAIALAAVGLLFLLLPRAMAAVSAGLSLWLAAAAWSESAGQRRS